MEVGYMDNVYVDIVVNNPYHNTDWKVGLNLDVLDNIDVDDVVIY
jgi:hypothetical protein